MVRMYSFDFSLRMFDPKKYELKVSTTILCYNEKLENRVLKPSSEKDIEEDDNIAFDEEFSNMLLLTFADLIHGEFQGKMRVYDIPEDALYISKVYNVEVDGKKIQMVKIYKKLNDKIDILYNERLPELQSIIKRVQRIKELTGLSENDIQDILG